MDPKEYKRLWASVGCELEYPLLEQLDPNIWSEENRLFVFEYGIPIGPVFYEYVNFSGSIEFECNKIEKRVYLTRSTDINIFFNYGCSKIANRHKNSNESETIAPNIGQFMKMRIHYNTVNRNLAQNIKNLTKQEIDSKTKTLRDVMLDEIGFDSNFWNLFIFYMHHEYSERISSPVSLDSHNDIFEYDEFDDYEYEPEDP